jgi:type I restriction enzyme S subunit
MKAGWTVKRLGDLSELITKGTTPTSVGHAFVSAGINFVKVESISETGHFIGDKLAHITQSCHDSLKRSQLKPGDILFSIAGALGRTALVTEEILPANTNQALAIIRLRKSSDIFPRFVLKALETGIVLEQIEKFKGGVAQQNLSLGQIQGFTIPIPPPSEQRRIVGILDEAFDGIAAAKANAEKNLQNASALFESCLQDVCTQRGERWVERRLGDVVERLTNGYVGPTRDIYLESGVPYLLARHVKNNRLTFDGKTFISDEFNRKNKKSILKAGDVLLVQSGHIGHSAVVTKDHVGHNCHAMIVITPIKGVLTGAYLSLYFNSLEMRQKFEQIRSGSTVPHLTCGAVKELMVTLPDVPTQQRLVARLRKLETETRRLSSIYRRKLAAFDELKKSLLHQAFSGEL